MTRNTQTTEGHMTAQLGDGDQVTAAKFLFRAREKDEDEWSFRSWSSTNISESDWNQRFSYDILVLQRMTEYMAERNKDLVSRLPSEAELRKYVPLAEARFDEIEHTDKTLRRAYEFLDIPGIDRVPSVKRKTEDMIKRLEAEPHFYCPGEREESDEVHVSRWLNKFTNNPEPEMCGFMSCGWYEPRRYVPSVEPRAIVSETNVLLGKRKREREEEDEELCVVKSSSELRLTCDEWYRPRKAKRAVRQGLVGVHV